MDWSCLMWYFFPRGIYLEIESLRLDFYPKKIWSLMYRPKYPKTNSRNLKNINPNPKDSDQRERKTQAVATQADPSRDDPGERAPGLGRARPGASAALGDQAREPQATATQASEPQAWVVRSGLKPPTAISDLDLLSLSVFGFFLFFFSCVLLWCSGGSSLICSYL